MTSRCVRPLSLAAVCLAAACGTPLDLGTDLVWATDNESGDLSAWSAPPGTGGPYAYFGNPSVNVSSEQAHSGRYSIKMASTAATPDPTSMSPGGGGMFKEGPFPQDAYYSVWYYLPQAYQTLTSWTILRFETRTVPGSDAGPADAAQDGDAGQVDAAQAGDAGSFTAESPRPSQLLDVRLQSQPDGTMTVVVFDHRNMYLTSPLPNPPPVVPIGKWFQLECFYRNIADPSGHLTIWIDGTMIYDLSRPMTANPSVYFTPCSLADNLSPSSLALYIDDIAISWRRVTRQGVLKLTN